MPLNAISQIALKSLIQPGYDTVKDLFQDHQQQWSPSPYDSHLQKVPSTMTMTTASTPTEPITFNPSRLGTPAILLRRLTFPRHYAPTSYPAQYTFPKTAKQLTADKGGDWEGYLASVAREHAPIDRFASPEELASFFVFLCSKRASYSVGSTYFVDGGMLKVV